MANRSLTLPNPRAHLRHSARRRWSFSPVSRWCAHQPRSPKSLTRLAASPPRPLRPSPFALSHQRPCDPSSCVPRLLVYAAGWRHLGRRAGLCALQHHRRRPCPDRRCHRVPHWNQADARGQQHLKPIGRVRICGFVLFLVATPSHVPPASSSICSALAGLLAANALEVLVLAHNNITSAGILDLGLIL